MCATSMVTLALLMTWILSTNYIEFSPTSHYFAALAKTSNGGFHLHTPRNSTMYTVEQIAIKKEIVSPPAETTKAYL